MKKKQPEIKIRPTGKCVIYMGLPGEVHPMRFSFDDHATALKILAVLLEHSAEWDVSAYESLEGEVTATLFSHVHANLDQSAESSDSKSE